MTKDQIEKIIAEIREKKNIAPAPHAKPGEPVPVPMSVLLVGGKQFVGTGFLDAQGNVHMSVERIEQAHRMKGPVSVWINVDSIQAIAGV
jgi:hypothetical protein